ncbi:hypothetical protein [Corynebacterium auris]|uniref:hypothetical protein n=1 Tax=Corynebacterium auris TaxID=44750 RepID=UPI0025B5B389|nr:hypothetical protein [Corynebacterium auris]
MAYVYGQYHAEGEGCEHRHEHHIDQIERSLPVVAEAMAQPDARQFTATHRPLEKLREALAYLGGIYASFAFICQCANAGAFVVATYPVEYFIQRMGVSRATAFEWLSRGTALFADPE